MSDYTTQRVFVFKTKVKSSNGMQYLIAIPENKLESIKTVYGSQNVELVVNGERVEGSFDYFVKFLASNKFTGARINVWELGPNGLQA